MSLSDRQQREIVFFRQAAAAAVAIADRPVNLEPTMARPCWRTHANAYWAILHQARKLMLRGKRVLVLGCGYGEDALQLAHLGARVSAADLSAEAVAIARRRAQHPQARYFILLGGPHIDFTVCPAESLPYADASFDLVYISDVAHHFDIPVALREVRRVLKPGAVMLANEPYTHSWAQLIRQARLVRERVYPRLIRLIYRADRPYVTADERKLDQHAVRQIGEILEITEVQYYSLLYARVTRWQYQLIIDRLILMLPWAGYFLAGRVVFAGRR